MPAYAVYTRTYAGRIVRARDLFTNYPADLLKLYFYKEPLTGFPENTVFWLNCEGPSVGLAPRPDIQKPTD